MHVARSPLLLPALGLGAWLAALTVSGRGLVIDEWIHLGAIAHLASGAPGVPDNLAMVPGYHWVMSWPFRWFGDYLVALRAVNVLFALLGLWAWAEAARAEGRDPRGPVLRAAWLPLLFPFLALIYTEALSFALVAAALACHARGRIPYAALCLAVSALVRQSNLVWALLLLGWLAADAGGPWREALVRALRRGWMYGVVLAGGGALLVSRGPVASVDPEVNAGYNPAQLTVFSVSLGLLALPVLVAGAVRRSGTRRWVVAAVLLTVVLAAGFRNPHAFNQGLDLWRNRLLHVMDADPAWRWGASAFAGATLASLLFWMRRQPARGRILWWGLVTLLYLAPHSVVEPRYYILPLLFLGHLAELPGSDARRLTWWLGLLTAAECLVLLDRGPLW